VIFHWSIDNGIDVVPLRYSARDVDTAFGDERQRTAKYVRADPAP
jgi:hypothetical protein